MSIISLSYVSIMILSQFFLKSVGKHFLCTILYPVFLQFNNGLFSEDSGIVNINIIGRKKDNSPPAILWTRLFHALDTVHCIPSATFLKSTVILIFACPCNMDITNLFNLNGIFCFCIEKSFSHSCVSHLTLQLQQICQD